MKRAAVILSQKFKRYIPADIVICADAGYDRALELGIKPTAVVGDLDSIEGDLGDVLLYKASTDKDFSDGEMALRHAIALGANFIDVFGAVGGRVDHTLYNMHLLKLANLSGAKAVIRGDNFDCYYSNDEFSIEVNVGDIVSVLPFSGDLNISKTSGLKYLDENAKITHSNTVGLSNVAIDKIVHISISNGDALIFINYTTK